MIDRRIGAAMAAAGLTITLAGAAAPAATAHTAGIHDNCTKFNQKYPHGVGRRHAHDQTSGTPVATFKRSNRIYGRAVNPNSDLDRDGDTIACEKA